MTSDNFLLEPGLWVAVALVAFSVVHFVAAHRSRALRLRALNIAESILNDPSASDADRVWIADTIEAGSGKHQGWIGFAAPLLFLGTLIFGLFDVFRGTKIILPEDSEISLSSARKQHDSFIAKTVELKTGVDPTEGHFWHDPRRQEISRIAWKTADLASPFAALSIYVWLGMAMVILAAFWGMTKAAVYVASRTETVTDISKQMAWHYLSR